MVLQPLIDFILKQQVQQVLVLTDSNVDACYPNAFDSLPALANVQCDKLVVPAGEMYKSIHQATEIWQFMLQKAYDKDVLLINFGGGMICDLGGFVAATYKRGIRVVNYPTTLLAMIDAAVGGKTAVNLQDVKNAIGLIRQPNFIMPANLQLLNTLKQDELLSGFGELIKYAIIALPDMFEQLFEVKQLTADVIRQEWVDACIRFKEQVVAVDPEDRNERHILNFGHTYGHALESYTLNAGQPLPHGIAVAMGCLYEAEVMCAQGLLSEEDCNKIGNLIRKFYKVPKMTKAFSLQLEPYIKQDKKCWNGSVNFNVFSPLLIKR